MQHEVVRVDRCASGTLFRLSHVFLSCGLMSVYAQSNRMRETQACQAGCSPSLLLEVSAEKFSLVRQHVREQQYTLTFTLMLIFKEFFPFGKHIEVSVFC